MLNLLAPLLSDLPSSESSIHSLLRNADGNGCNTPFEIDTYVMYHLHVTPTLLQRALFILSFAFNANPCCNERFL